jgi:hypothetical protein
MNIKMAASAAICFFIHSLCRTFMIFLSKIYKAGMKPIHIAIVTMVVAVSGCLYLMWPASEILQAFRSAPQVAETSPVVLPSKFMQLTSAEMVDELKGSGFKCQKLETKINCMHPETNFPCTDYYHVTIMMEPLGKIPLVLATKFTNCA